MIHKALYAVHLLLCRLGHHWWVRVPFRYEILGPMALRRCRVCERQEELDDVGFSGQLQWRKSLWTPSD